MRTHAPRRRQAAFTLIELLVVMAIIATLLTIVVPRYFQSLERAKETTLRQDLQVMREAIDKFRGDTGNYPASLSELVDRRYLRSLPPDPITGSRDTWVVSPASDTGNGGIRDVHSGAAGTGLDGTPYSSW